MNKKSKTKYIFCGPTAGGKSSFSESFAESVDGEIVNADACQIYVPLCIGTAKPDVSKIKAPCHLFGFINEPRTISVSEYAGLVHAVCDDIELRDKTACLVGGSGFYLHSLFFAPENMDLQSKSPEPQGDVSWGELSRLDPIRAQEIHPHDVYRIQRAFEIFHATGKLPSQIKPEFHDFGAKVIFIEREKEDLWSRISRRIDEMIEAGWVEEVETLSSEWRDFVCKRNILGYPYIIDYIDGKISLSQAKELIYFATRQYAKRQSTFNRRFKSILTERGVTFFIFNLTLCAPDLYLKQLLVEHF